METITIEQIEIAEKYLDEKNITIYWGKNCNNKIVVFNPFSDEPRKEYNTFHDLFADYGLFGIDNYWLNGCN